jgi:hypothetical protein
MKHSSFSLRWPALVGLALILILGTGSPAAPVSAAETTEILSTTDGLPGIRFLHVSTTENVVGNWTYVDHPLLNGDPNAILIVTQNVNAGGGTGGTINEHLSGVWYDTLEGKWAIYNEDGASMPVGADFNVLIPDPATGVFVHEATAGNTSDHITYIDHPLTNNQPDALLFVTHNWNPGGTGGTYNDHPIGVRYDGGMNQWAIFNEDLADMPTTAAFNVLVAEPGSGAFVHYATPENDVTGSTLVPYPSIDDDTHALLFVTHNWNPGGVGGTYNAHPFNVYYNYVYYHWGISNLGVGNPPIATGAAFNVLVVRTPTISFFHTATAGNISTNSTFIDHERLNNEPNAVFQITQNWNPGGVGGIYNNHPVGVWYSGLSDEWAIFNQDGADMPENADFNVVIPHMDAGVFVHEATTDTLSNNSTFLTHPLTDGDPDAIIFVTQNWNPGSVGGVYNNHPVGVWYNDLSEEWAIFNEDNVDMPEGAAFNVYIPLPDSTVFVHEATPGNSLGNSTYLAHPLLNDNPYARILVTQNWNPGGGLSGVYNPHVIGVWYDTSTGEWAIFNQDGVDMPEGAAFNVLVESNRVYLPIVLRAF